MSVRVAFGRRRRPLLRLPPRPRLRVMARPSLPRCFQLLIFVSLCGVIALTRVMLVAIASATEPDTWPNGGMLRWEWPASCNASLASGGHPAAAVGGENYFTLHMFFMVIAFCLLAPLGSIWYYFLEDMCRLPHDFVKWTHALVQLGAVVASVLGFIQIYFSNGGSCDFSQHFLSLHSFIALPLLAAFWAQWPLAGLFFSNTTLLKPGTASRKAFLRGHVVVGKGATLLGLVVVILGIVAFETKRTQWVHPGAPAAFNEVWFNFARGGTVAFGVCVAIGLIYACAPAPAPPAAQQTAKLTPSPETPSTAEPLLLPPNSTERLSDGVGALASSSSGPLASRCHAPTAIPATVEP